MRCLQLGFAFDSTVVQLPFDWTSIRRPFKRSFDCLSKVVKGQPSRSHADLLIIYVGRSAAARS